MEMIKCPKCGNMHPVIIPCPCGYKEASKEEAKKPEAKKPEVAQEASDKK